MVAVLPEFSLACLLLAVLPGPATALFLHRSVRDGRSAGLAAVAGNEIGIFGWALAAGAGLSTLLETNRLLFDSLHVVGALVLVYLGISAWRSAGRADAHELDIGLAGQPSIGSPGAALRASLISIAANPKAAAFAFSFFPQFLPKQGPVFATTVALAGIQVVIDSIYCIMIVLLAVRMESLLSRAAVRRRLERVLGAVLVALGVQLATDTR